MFALIFISKEFFFSLVFSWACQCGKISFGRWTKCYTHFVKITCSIVYIRYNVCVCVTSEIWNKAMLFFSSWRIKKNHKLWPNICYKYYEMVVCFNVNIVSYFQSWNKNVVCVCVYADDTYGFNGLRSSGAIVHCH